LGSCKQRNFEIHHRPILDYQEAITAILVGIGLSISGLLMQRYLKSAYGLMFLGLSSGSSLGVAFVILGAEFYQPFYLKFYFRLWNNYSFLFGKFIQFCYWF
jgi:ABC-type Fe3+-siderophore transport system permease subunit